MPDGSVELFFHYGSPFYKIARNGDTDFIKEKSLILGQLQDYVLFKSTGPVGFIGVKFKANGFQRLVRPSLHEFTDKAVDIKDIWGKEAKLLEERIANENNNNKRVQLIELFLLKHLHQHTDPFMNHCVNLMIKQEGNLKVKELSKHLNISSRQLERKFMASIGISPNNFSRINRVQKALISMEKRDYASLTQLGYQHGYYDQSHFIKEIDKFVGLTPGDIQIIESCYSKTAFL